MENQLGLFSEADRSSIELAIAEAEKLTSGEIRVHVDEYCSEPVMDRAAFMFSELEMHKTDLRNGVLIYLSTEDRKLAVIGDAGIHHFLGDIFWNALRHDMTVHFKSGEYAQGLTEAIMKIGEELKNHFPYQSNDSNELPNTISFGNQRKH
jgi:uncharacterized membrane protein